MLTIKTVIYNTDTSYFIIFVEYFLHKFANFMDNLFLKNTSIQSFTVYNQSPQSHLILVLLANCQETKAQASQCKCADSPESSLLGVSSVDVDANSGPITSPYTTTYRRFEEAFVHMR